jgi:hypothetical protein
MNRKVPPRNKGPEKRPRAVTYGPEVVEALVVMWKVMKRPGGKKMQAAMDDWLPFLDFRPEVKEKMWRISASQIDRLLKPIKALLKRKENTGTRPAPPEIRTKIPLKPLGSLPSVVGYLEVDTVAHCGDSLSGEFMWSLTGVDLKSRWTEVRAVWTKDSYRIKEALESIEQGLPFELKGFYSDCGSEFINSVVYEQFANASHRSKKLEMGHGRSYHKNDQAFVEQKNNTHVRQLLGYGRLDYKALLVRVNSLYEDWCALNNFFMPQVQLIEKERVGSRLRRFYSEPETPFSRILRDPQVPESVKCELRRKKCTLNPVALSRTIKEKVAYIMRTMDIHQSQRGRAAA